MSPSDLSTMGNSVDQGVKLIGSEIGTPHSKDQTPIGINLF